MNKFISFCLLLALPITLISCNTSKDEVIQSNPSPKEEVTSGLQGKPNKDLILLHLIQRTIYKK